MWKNCNAPCAASESHKQNPPDRTIDLPFSFRLKHTASLKTYTFQGNFAAMFVFKHRFKESISLYSLIPLNLRVEKTTDAIVLQNLPLFLACAREKWFLRGVICL